jgi:riboflavin biosynthesis pyrimidine reductase
VVTNSVDLDFDSTLFTQAVTPTILITCAAAAPERLAAARAAGADVAIAGGAMVEFPLAVKALQERGLRRMLCEGGPHLLAQVAAAGTLDELCLTMSPLLTAGMAPRILTGAGPTQPLRLRIRHVLEEDGYLFLRYETWA